MIEYILKHSNKDTMIYATFNKFDYCALFSGKKGFLKDHPLLRGGLLMHSRYKHLRFYDTMSYYKGGVEKIGKMLKKPKISFNLSKNSKNMSKWQKRKMITYNKRDCEITREFMIGFQEFSNKLGAQLKMTIGSCSMNLFKRRFLKEKIYHEYIKDKTFKNGQTVKEFIFSGYHGGRTEMFRRGTDKNHIYFKYDFNSMYSSVMQEEYPKPSSAQMQESESVKLNIDTILKYEGISEIDITIPYMYYPPLPVYMQDKLCFPIGKIKRQVFTNIEIREALKLGCKITAYYKGVYYTKTFSPFKEYVKEIYSFKEKYSIEDNQVYREVAKMYLNNLYGKFGQHKLIENEFFDYDERNDNDSSQDGIIFDEEAGFGIRETPKDSDNSFVIPIFAVYTTAKARIKLLRKLIKLKGIYIDTDSIISDKKIKTSDKLGELKLEGTLNSINIVKQKHYKETDDKGVSKYKIKGLHMSKNIEDKEQEFEDSITGKNIKQMHIVGIKEAVRKGLKINEQIFITKKFDLTDTKRIWIKPYEKDVMRDSRPIIIGFDNIKDLTKYYESLPKNII
jgi:hypothetical protein